MPPRTLVFPAKELPLLVRMRVPGPDLLRAPAPVMVPERVTDLRSAMSKVPEGALSVTGREDEKELVTASVPPLKVSGLAGLPRLASEPMEMMPALKALVPV